MAGSKTGGAGQDADWDEQQRHETPTERLDRNWGDLLQELRVLQTGVQLLTGFLLTLPFQQKFSTLSSAERTLYLVAVSCSILATGFLETPVALHRALFRQHRRARTVELAHRLAVVGIVFLGAAVVSVATLIFDVLLGWGGGITAGVLTAALLVVLWLLLPWTVRRGTDR